MDDKWVDSIAASAVSGRKDPGSVAEIQRMLLGFAARRHEPLPHSRKNI